MLGLMLDDSFCNRNNLPCLLLRVIQKVPRIFVVIKELNIVDYTRWPIQAALKLLYKKPEHGASSASSSLRALRPWRTNPWRLRLIDTQSHPSILIVTLPPVRLGQGVVTRSRKGGGSSLRTCRHPCRPSSGSPLASPRKPSCAPRRTWRRSGRGRRTRPC